ncbi:nucleoporin NDC1 [Dethiobacter alkaliphilus]|uniref:nucleoporin NDC1 n=1 Tax=Dethiobacter alkaliphilus TaxID=427926 RepID=UPI00222656EE|nr:nucleoporin NDC1 [Dethiobacter alkaliphilus]MCW3490383.1 nucleoporin NDC1 [Dethiobacter alkaliphilus]
MQNKIVAFQMLFINSNPGPGQAVNGKNFVVLILIVVLGSTLLMTRIFSSSFMPAWLIYLISFSIMNVNNHINSDRRLYELVPVSRTFTVLNIYLNSAIFAVLYIIGSAIAVVLIGLYFDSSAEPMFTAFEQAIFMFLLLIIILFMGTTIAFVKKPVFRFVSYAVFFGIIYSFLSILKSQMPALPTTGEVDFMESLLIMPQVNSILLWLSVITLFIIPLSIYAGCKLYHPGIGSVRKSAV